MFPGLVYEFSLRSTEMRIEHYKKRGQRVLEKGPKAMVKGMSKLTASQVTCRPWKHSYASEIAMAARKVTTGEEVLRAIQT